MTRELAIGIAVGLLAAGLIVAVLLVPAMQAHEIYIAGVLAAVAPVIVALVNRTARRD